MTPPPADFACFTERGHSLPAPPARADAGRDDPLARIGSGRGSGSFAGRRFGGYQLGELIGSGGMGEVYRAEQATLARTVAVKVLHPWLCSDDRMLERFYQEARAASQLNHPHTVAVIDFGVDDGRPFLVMEHLPGVSLLEHVVPGKLLPVRRVCEVLLDVLSALSEAHAAGVVHRDLKPENVLLVPRRSGGHAVKVVDFGLAQIADVSDRSGRRCTEPGMCVGTPEYMAPEQFLGGEVDGRADLYAIAVVLYELLVGAVPFAAERFSQLAVLHICARPPDAVTAAPGRVTPLLARILRRGLAKQPEHRFASAAQMAAALSCALTEQRQSQPSLQRADGRGSLVVVPRAAAPLAAVEVRSRRLLQAATVLGGWCTREAVLDVADEPDEALLADLVFRGALLPAGPDELVLEAEIYDEIDSTMPREVRRALHDRAYEHLVERGAPPDTLASHAVAGSDPVLALVLLEQLGTAAQSRRAWTSAIAAYRSALETARNAALRTGDEQFTEAVSTFSEKLAQALCADGRTVEADGVLREALGATDPQSAHRQRLLSALQPIAELRAHAR